MGSQRWRHAHDPNRLPDNCHFRGAIGRGPHSRWRRCGIVGVVAELSPVIGFHAAAVTPFAITYAATSLSILFTTSMTGAGTKKRDKVKLMNTKKMMLMLAAGLVGSVGAVFAGITAAALG